MIFFLTIYEYFIKLQIQKFFFLAYLSYKNENMKMFK